MEKRIPYLDEFVRTYFLNRDVIDGLMIRTDDKGDKHLIYLLLQDGETYHKIPFVPGVYSHEQIERDSHFMIPKLDEYADAFSYDTRNLCLSRISAAGKRDLDSIALYSARAGVYPSGASFHKVDADLSLIYEESVRMNLLWYVLETMSEVSADNIINFAALAVDADVSLNLTELAAFFRAVQKISAPVGKASESLFLNISENYFSDEQRSSGLIPDISKDFN